MRTFQAQKLDAKVGRGRKKLDVPYVFNGLRAMPVNKPLTPGNPGGRAGARTGPDPLARGQRPRRSIQWSRSGVGEYVDQGISGAKGRDKRPAFDRLCKAGQAASL